jgi:hypothetical protein
MQSSITLRSVVIHKHCGNAIKADTIMWSMELDTRCFGSLSPPASCPQVEVCMQQAEVLLVHHLCLQR